LSFVLLSGAAMLLATLVSLQRVETGYEMRRVLAIDVPLPLETPRADALAFYEEARRRIAALPRVQHVAVGNFVPWRDLTSLLPTMPFTVEGHPSGNGEDPRARLRNVTPGFFAALGVRFLSGRDFTDEDRRGSELVAIVSQSVARRMFPNGHAIDRQMWWTHPLFGKPAPRRIVGIVADVDDESVVPGPAMTVYHPLSQMPFGGRLFVHASGDPYGLAAPVTRVVRDLSADQPVERAATLADVRAEVLAPERLNAFVFSGFAAVALLIAIVGVAGVLAFSVSARTREFGVRLAIGSTPRRLMVSVLSEGALIVIVGILAGAAGGYALVRAAASHLERTSLPGILPLLGAATLLVFAAIVASLMPAARASRVDVLAALRSE
jgi:putative ABC transport system permease protein